MTRRSARGDRFSEATRVFKREGGVLRTMEAVRRGVHPRTLYAMRDAGVLDQLGRGLYRLAELPPLDHPELVTVAMRIPGGVLCLLSALAFHEMTEEEPEDIHIALERGAEAPRLEHPPVQAFSFGGRAFSEGIELYEIDGVEIRVYSAAKTVADCFKFRSKVGLDALKTYMENEEGSADELMKFARTCRVTTVIRPYVEALL